MSDCAGLGVPAAGASETTMASPDGAEDVRENGHVPGLPRPRADGMPVPWITFMLDVEDVWWRTIDTPRLLLCQAQWRCQVCGLELPTQAWVVVNADGEVLSDAALHRACLTIAKRWCPELRQSGYRPLVIDRHRILADNMPLDNFAPGDADNEWGTYGDRVRRWTVAMPSR